MWPKTTFLLPGWPRDTKRLDTPDRVSFSLKWRPLEFVSPGEWRGLRALGPELGAESKENLALASSWQRKSTHQWFRFCRTYFSVKYSFYCDSNSVFCLHFPFHGGYGWVTVSLPLPSRGGLAPASQWAWLAATLRDSLAERHAGPKGTQVCWICGEIAAGAVFLGK